MVFGFRMLHSKNHLRVNAFLRNTMDPDFPSPQWRLVFWAVKPPKNTKYSIPLPRKVETGGIGNV
jgi:hypothetical protein